MKKELCSRCSRNYYLYVIDEVPLCKDCFREWKYGLVPSEELEYLKCRFAEGG